MRQRSAEERFKAVVTALVEKDEYPAPAACGRALGRSGLRSLSGRETRWRREVLTQFGWTELRWPHRRRYSWVPKARGEKKP